MQVFGRTFPETNVGSKSKALLDVYDEGYAAKLSARDVRLLLLRPDVQDVEPNYVAAATEVQVNAPWNLCAISAWDFVRPEQYKFRSNGTGVDIYILDTGIRINDREFGGRASVGRSFETGDAAKDLNGHGTAVASIAASKTFGVAKGANLIAVKVLNDTGFGSARSVMSGLQYVARQHPVGSRAIINLSLSLKSKISFLNHMVNKATLKGVMVVVAAGNDAQDACTISPASAAGAITVGATDSANSVASFSNTGPCVDVFAPGVDVALLRADGRGSGSGTSFSAPHVAGVLARYVEGKGQYSIAVQFARMLQNSVPGTVMGADNRTMSKLLRMNPAI